MKTKNFSVCLNPQANGGESVMAKVEIAKHVGEPAFVNSMTIETTCHGVHSSTISLHADMRGLPFHLRELANRIETKLLCFECEE